MNTKFDLSLNRRSSGRAGRMNCPGIIETAYEVKGTAVASEFVNAVSEIIATEEVAYRIAMARLNRRNDRSSSSAVNACAVRLSVAERARAIAA